MAAAFAVAIGCAAAPSKAPALNGRVGRVSVADLARVLKEMSIEGEKPRQLIPFLIVVHPLTAPKEPSRVKCKWGEPPVPEAGVYRVEDLALGRLQSYRVVAVDDESREIGGWKTGYKLMLSDGGYSDAPDQFDHFSPSPDWDRIQETLRFDKDLTEEPATSTAVVQFGPVRTYHAALLCQDGDEAALLVDFADGPLNGQGYLLVLQRAGGRWELVGARQLWVS